MILMTNLVAKGYVPCTYRGTLAAGWLAGCWLAGVGLWEKVKWGVEGVLWVMLGWAWHSGRPFLPNSTLRFGDPLPSPQANSSLS